MIYLYYDKDGALKEIINDKTSRKGSANIDGIAVYCELFDDENYSVTDIWYVQQFPDKTKSIEVSFWEGSFTSTIPYTKGVDHRFFKDFTTYKFYKLAFDSSLLSQNGLNIGTIRLALNNGASILALGMFTFNVENNVVKIDNYLTQSQYDYFVQLLSDKDKTFNNIVVNQKATLNNLELKGKVIGNLNPYEDNKYDLGSSTKQWQDLRLSGKLYMKGYKTLEKTNNNELWLNNNTYDYIGFDNGKLMASSEKNFEFNSGKVHILSDVKNAEDSSSSKIEFNNSNLDIYDSNEIKLHTTDAQDTSKCVKLGGKEQLTSVTKINNLFAVKAGKELPAFVVGTNINDNVTMALNGTAYYNGQEVQRKRDDWSTKDTFNIIKSGLTMAMTLNKSKATFKQDAIQLGDTLQNTSTIEQTGNNYKLTCGTGEIIGNSVTYNGTEIVNQNNLEKNVFKLSAYDLEVTLDNDYVLTIALKNKEGDIIASQSVDFPTETSIVGIEWDEKNNALIFELRNGNKTSVPIGSILTGLVTETKLTDTLAPINEDISKMDTRVGQIESLLNANVVDEMLNFSRDFSIINEVLEIEL